MCLCNGGREDRHGEGEAGAWQKPADYMVPEYVVEMEKLPLTRNGKVDRKRACRHRRSKGKEASHEAPVSGIEKKLAEIWGEVLDIDRVGVNDILLNGEDTL
ncbi:hypothetical protein [Paenibacillus larvae]|uniref:hypothetical protein n=1 Tax=Paenibacillus larvae TaxID=1464 RepID=UPI0028925832|nr:hypothetical protein [Paenibacillus larvae]MDT2194460.1 hypothetical protein [Paenibacillus larvae]